MRHAIVIGAGAAGLAASRELLKAGWRVTLLEARGRVGGRLHGLVHAPGVPVDLGPEFLHGHAPEVRNLVPRESVVAEASESGLLSWRGKVSPADDLMEDLAGYHEELRDSSPDQPVAALFSRLNLSALEEASLRSYLEGFNALDVNRASQSALRRESGAGDEEESIGRLRGGYSSLLPALEEEWGDKFSLCLQSRARRIDWQEGKVRVSSKSPIGTRLDEADRVLITLPTSLLAEESELEFSPDLPELRKAARLLPMGSVHKVVAMLKRPLWETEGKDISFLSSPELLFGIRWIWSLHSQPILSCWSGGSRSAQLDGLSQEEVIDQALADTATALGRPLAEVKAAVERCYYHDWVADPFSKGAYAYVRVGGADAREILARPVTRTLYFAGEATMSDGSAGTVHGALRSGIRAARAMLQGA